DCETVIADDRQGPGLRCCGRPLISNGLLAEAVECARANVDQLFPWAEAGQAITACEPSCLLTIKDDYPALLRGDQRRRAEVVARACRTWEEFVHEAFAAAGTAAATFEPLVERILGQHHFHQR